VVALNVAVDQKPLAVFGNVVGEDVGGGNGARPWTWKRVAGVPVTKVLSALTGTAINMPLGAM
jgi:hypothetical protein